MRQKLNILKRQHIRQQFRRFEKLCTDIPVGKRHYLDGSKYDPPDVCIGEGVLGIEFTDFFHGEKSTHGSDWKVSEEFYKEITKEAEWKYKQQSDTLLHVTPLWTNNKRPPKSEKHKIVQALLEIVIRSTPSYYNGHVQLTSDDFIGSPLDGYLVSIGITKFRQGYSTWANSASGNTYVNVEALEAIVRSKETSLERNPNKFRKFQKVWLIIVARGDSLPSHVNLDNSVTSGCIKSLFDRVYFLSMVHMVDNTNIIRLTGDQGMQGG